MNTSAVQHKAQDSAPRWAEPIAAAIGIFAVATIGGMVTGPVVQSEWYQNLQQPAFAPPSSVFAPVWTTLYTLMVIAYILVWRTGSSAKSWRVAFAVQAGLNLFWSLMFFGARTPEGGLAVIFMLLAAIVVNMVLFWKHSRWAGILLIPYLLWVSFATVLNASIASLN